MSQATSALKEALPKDRQELIRRMKRLRLPMFIIATIAYMFVTFHRLTPSVMGSTLISSMGLNPSEFAWIGTVYMWVYAICQAPVGTALDKLGTRKGLSILLICTCLGGCIFATAQNLAMLLIGRALVALSVSGFMVGGAKVCSLWYSDKEYTTYYPIFMAFGAMGGVFATTPLAFLMETLGWRWAIVAISLFSLLLGILSALFVRDDPESVGLPSAEALLGDGAKDSAPVNAAEAEVEAAEELVEEPKKQKASIGTVLAMPILWLCLLVAMGPNASGQCLQSLWEGVYLADVFNYDSVTVANILMCASVGLVLGSVCSAMVVKKIGLAKTTMFSMIVFLVAWLYMTIRVDSLSVIELCVINLVLGTCQMCTITTNFTVLRQMMPTERLGTAMGILNSCIWIIGAGLFQQVWGWIIQAIDGAVRPYTAVAFGTCMWVQVIVIALSVLATVIVYVQAKRGVFTSRDLLK